MTEPTGTGPGKGEQSSSGTETETAKEEELKKNGNGKSKAPIEEVQRVFTKWFGELYDLDLIYVVLATAAAEKLAGDPLWLMLVGGPGSAKSETLAALSTSGARVIGGISSPAAFLSGTSANTKEGEEPGTGGILRSLGERGLLVAKDFTSILTMHHVMRGAVLAAFREIYDGHWVRDLGNKGGKTLEWRGRVGFIGGVTGAWDKHYEVIGQMGDRFAVLRLDSWDNREEACKQSLMNGGVERQMREELSFAARAVLQSVQRGVIPERRDADIIPISKAANAATMARSTVTRDARGNLEDVEAPEMPTRFVKQLSMLLHGAKAIGLSPEKALSLTMRVARDSITPPLRLAVLQQLAAAPTAWNHGGVYSAKQLSDTLGRPHSSVSRACQELWMLGLVERESEEPDGEKGRPKILYNAAAKWREHITYLMMPSAG